MTSLRSGTGLASPRVCLTAWTDSVSLIFDDFFHYRTLRYLLRRGQSSRTFYD